MGKMADFPEGADSEFDHSKKDINGILTDIKRKFQIIDVSWTNNNKHFEAKFRTQICRDSKEFNALCDEWVEMFSDVTQTLWVDTISNTGPKVKFRKQYQCWTLGDVAVKKELLFDRRRCNATLDMKVLTDHPSARKKNNHHIAGLNVFVKMNFNHHHECDPSTPLSFYVHKCEPLPELPKPQAQPNHSLQKLIEKEIQNASIVSQKAAAKAEECLRRINGTQTEIKVDVDEGEGNNAIQQVQFMVTSPQIEVSENILLDQPIVIEDYPQVIPIGNLHNYIQVQTQEGQSQNLQYM